MKPVCALIAMMSFLVFSAAICGSPDDESPPRAIDSTVASETPAPVDTEIAAAPATPPVEAAATVTPVEALATPVPPTETPVSEAVAIPLRSGEKAVGGTTYLVGRTTFTIPVGEEFNTLTSLNDPGGYLLFVLVHVKTGSTLKINPETGTENGRYVADSSAIPILDEIAASLRLAK